jgi:hypothetical protein
MPHLDEGVLHAYLDGALPLASELAAEVQSCSDAESRVDGDEVAFRSVEDVEQHLNGCGECRAALEHARQIKEASAGILSAAGPENVIPPSFEELQRRAKTDRSGTEKHGGRGAGLHGRRFVRMRSLAWAATVVLAAMVGWYARSALLTKRSDHLLSESGANARLTVPIPQTPSQVADEDSPEQTEVRARGEPVEEAAQAISTHEPAAEAVTVVPVAGVRAQQAPPGAPVEPSAIPDRQKGQRETGRVDSGEAIERVVNQPEERRMEEAQPAGRAVAADAAPAPLMAQAAGGLGEETELQWITVDEAGAADVLRRPVPKIEGLAVVGYTTDYRAVRILQTLDSGSLVEIVAYPDVFDQSTAIDKKGVVPPEAANTVVVRRDDLVIRITAAVDADSLNALSQKIVSP